MTAVIFYVEDVYDDGGNRTGEVEATQDIVVSPRSIIDYGEKYIMLARCKLTQISGKYSGIDTGKVTVHEDADDRTITELIKVS